MIDAPLLVGKWTMEPVRVEKVGDSYEEIPTVPGSADLWRGAVTWVTDTGTYLNRVAFDRVPDDGDLLEWAYEVNQQWNQHGPPEQRLCLRCQDGQLATNPDGRFIVCLLCGFGYTPEIVEGTTIHQWNGLRLERRIETDDQIVVLNPETMTVEVLLKRRVG